MASPRRTTAVMVAVMVYLIVLFLYSCANAFLCLLMAVSQ